MKSLLLSLIVAAAPFCAAVAQNASPLAGDPAAGQTVFVRCSGCHQVGPTAQNGAGPELNGIIGQKAGVVPGFDFSDAMKNSGITWDVPTLAAYLKSPRTVVPGNKMSFPGLPQAQDVANVIAYLATFNADGSPATPAASTAPAAPASSN